MLTTRSHSDFDNTKLAEYYDADGFFVADKANKHLLNKPRKIKSVEQKQTKKK